MTETVEEQGTMADTTSAAAPTTSGWKFWKALWFGDFWPFLGFSAVPAVAPLLIIWLLGRRSLTDLISNGTLYLIAIAACGTLTLMSLSADRIEDRSLLYPFIFTVVIVACVAWGVEMSIPDGRASKAFLSRSRVLAGFLAVAAIVPIGIVTSWSTSRKRLRSDQPNRRKGDPTASSEGPKPPSGPTHDLNVEELRSRMLRLEDTVAQILNGQASS